MWSDPEAITTPDIKPITPVKNLPCYLIPKCSCLLLVKIDTDFFIKRSYLVLKMCMALMLDLFEFQQDRLHRLEVFMLSFLIYYISIKSCSAPYQEVDH